MISPELGVFLNLIPQYLKQKNLIKFIFALLENLLDAKIDSNYDCPALFKVTFSWADEVYE